MDTCLHSSALDIYFIINAKWKVDIKYCLKQFDILYYCENINFVTPDELSEVSNLTFKVLLLDTLPFSYLFDY